MNGEDKEVKYGEIPLPYKGTPRIALGAVFVLSMVFTSGVSAWLAVSPDFRTWMANKKETELASIAAADDSNKRLTDGVLSAVGRCAEQLSALSRVMGTLAGEKDEISRKLTILQEEAQRQLVVSTTCEKNLELCTAKRIK